MYVQYRRVALYGIDRLIEDKQAQKDSTGRVMTDDVIRTHTGSPAKI